VEIKSILQTFLQPKNVEQTKPLQIKIGQLMQGKVLELLNSKYAMVSINGMKVIAKNEVPLEKGQKAWFMVTSMDDELPKLKLINTIKPANQELSSAELIKALHLNDTPEMHKIISFFTKNQWPLNRQSVQEIEQLLLHNKVPITDVLQRRKLSKEFRLALETLILQQAGAGVLDNEQQPFTQSIFQFPHFLPLSEQPVYLQVKSKKNGSQKIDLQDVKLVFLFQFENLGEMIIQLHLSQKQVIVIIYNNHESIMEIVKHVGPSFETFLKEQGYQTTGIQIRPMKDIQEVQQRYQTTTTVYHGVDIKI